MTAVIADHGDPHDPRCHRRARLHTSWTFWLRHPRSNLLERFTHLAQSQRQLLVFDDGEASLSYGYNRVRFPSPVPNGSRIRMGARVLQVDAVGVATQLTIECVIGIEHRDKPSCVSEAIWRQYPVPQPA